jgi:DNA-binding response OmpR family regulator
MPDTKAVLVIDDDENMRACLYDFFTSAGFSASCCDNGPAALDLTKRERFHVIITDYQMEGMNGADITRELRIRCPDSLIIGMSGEQKEKDFFEAGADAFCKKPFTLKKLFSLIQEKLPS